MPRIETAGVNFVDQKPPKACKGCAQQIFVALIRHSAGQYKWHNYDRQPIERAGQRVYTRHVCPR
jgi:hypothetical protein